MTTPLEQYPTITVTPENAESLILNWAEQCGRFESPCRVLEHVRSHSDLLCPCMLKAMHSDQILETADELIDMVEEVLCRMPFSA